jgi:hypothetical protein
MVRVPINDDPITTFKVLLGLQWVPTGSLMGLALSYCGVLLGSSLGWTLSPEYGSLGLSNVIYCYPMAPSKSPPSVFPWSFSKEGENYPDTLKPPAQGRWRTPWPSLEQVASSLEERDSGLMVVFPPPWVTLEGQPGLLSVTGTGPMRGLPTEADHSPRP